MMETSDCNWEMWGCTWESLVNKMGSAAMLLLPDSLESTVENLASKMDSLESNLEMWDCNLGRLGCILEKWDCNWERLGYSLVMLGYSWVTWGCS